MSRRSSESRLNAASAARGRPDLMASTNSFSRSVSAKAKAAVPAKATRRICLFILCIVYKILFRLASVLISLFHRIIHLSRTDANPYHGRGRRKGAPRPPSPKRMNACKRTCVQKKSKRVKPFSRDSHFNISTFLYLSTDSPRPGMEVISTTPSFTVMRT